MMTISLGTYLASFYAMLQVSEVEAADFGELGRLLLGGFAAAIVVALTFTLLRLRLREKRPTRSQFISISAPDDDAISSTMPASVSEQSLLR